MSVTGPRGDTRQATCRSNWLKDGAQTAPLPWARAARHDRGPGVFFLSLW